MREPKVEKTHFNTALFPHLSAASGASLNTSDAISAGGKLSWNGVLKKCCCSCDRCTTVPPRTTRKPESPMLAVYSLRSACENIMTHAVEEPTTDLRLSCISLEIRIKNSY